jgi:hypothetical protein
LSTFASEGHICRKTTHLGVGDIKSHTHNAEWK